MSDYSTASQSAQEQLESSSDGMIEEYEIRSNGRRVKRGRLQDQVQAAALLEGLAARRHGKLFHLARFGTPQ